MTQSRVANTGQFAGEGLTRRTGGTLAAIRYSGLGQLLFAAPFELRCSTGRSLYVASSQWPVASRILARAFAFIASLLLSCCDRHYNILLPWYNSHTVAVCLRHPCPWCAICVCASGGGRGEAAKSVLVSVGDNDVRTMQSDRVLRFRLRAQVEIAEVCVHHGVQQSNI